jgi:hypothetical protein
LCRRKILEQGNVRPRRKGAAAGAGDDDGLHGSAKPDFTADVAEPVIHFEGEGVVCGGAIKANQSNPISHLVEEILLNPILHVDLSCPVSCSSR